MDPEDGTKLGTYGARTIGFFWYNSTDIDFYLQDGNTLHIASDKLALEPTVRTTSGMTPVEHRRKLWFGLVKKLLDPWKAHAPTTQPEPKSKCVPWVACSRSEANAGR